MADAQLDVNVLVALFREGHVDHEIAHDWFADNARHGCVLGNPARIEQHVPIARVVELLSRFCDHSKHHFWRDDLSLRNPAVFALPEIRGDQRRPTSICWVWR